jgi:hypothetical protein
MNMKKRYEVYNLKKFIFKNNESTVMMYKANYDDKCKCS